MHHDNINAPVLPPDDQACLQRGNHVRIPYDNIEEAKSAYKTRISMNTTTHCKYLYGSRYKKIFNGYTKIIDVRDHGGSVDFQIFGHQLMKMKHISSDNHILECCNDVQDFMNDNDDGRSIHIIVSTKDEGE